MTKYTLRFVNKSTASRNFIVFQKDPDLKVRNVMSLAWFAKAARPGTVIDFSWTIDYSFVWSETGVLRPGVTFLASQTLPADPDGVNQVQFDYKEGAFGFSNPGSGGTKGSLTINTAGGFPAEQASIGIGMSGAGTFAVQAFPNDNAVFTPHPQYWVAFGNYAKGEVLDISNVSNSSLVAFPPNVYAMVATLDSGFNWNIVPLPQHNAAYLARQERINALEHMEFASAE